MLEEIVGVFNYFNVKVFKPNGKIHRQFNLEKGVQPQNTFYKPRFIVFNTTYKLFVTDYSGHTILQTNEGYPEDPGAPTFNRPDNNHVHFDSYDIYMVSTEIRRDNKIQTNKFALPIGNPNELDSINMTSKSRMDTDICFFNFDLWMRTKEARIIKENAEAIFDFSFGCDKIAINYRTDCNAGFLIIDRNGNLIAEINDMDNSLYRNGYPHKIINNKLYYMTYDKNSEEEKFDDLGYREVVNANLFEYDILTKKSTKISLGREGMRLVQDINKRSNQGLFLSDNQRLRKIDPLTNEESEIEIINGGCVQYRNMIVVKEMAEGFLRDFRKIYYQDNSGCVTHFADGTVTRGEGVVKVKGIPPELMDEAKKSMEVLEISGYNPRLKKVWSFNPRRYFRMPYLSSDGLFECPGGLILENGYEIIKLSPFGELIFKTELDKKYPHIDFAREVS